MSVRLLRNPAPTRAAGRELASAEQIDVTLAPFLGGPPAQTCGSANSYPVEPGGFVRWADGGLGEQDKR